MRARRGALPAAPRLLLALVCALATAASARPASRDAPHAGRRLASLTTETHIEDGSASADDLVRIQDRDPAACGALQPDAASPFGGSAAWLTFDEGAEVAMESIAILAGRSGVPATARLGVYHDLFDAGQPEAEAAAACDDAVLEPGTWTVAACNRTGRYVLLTIPGAAAAVELCQVELRYSGDAKGTGSDVTGSTAGGGGGGGGGGLSAGAIAGIAVGATAAAALLAGAGYVSWRRRAALPMAPGGGGKALEAAESGGASSSTLEKSSSNGGDGDGAGGSGGDGSLAGSLASQAPSHGVQLAAFAQPGVSPFASAAPGSTTSSLASGAVQHSADLSHLPAFSDVSPGDITLLEVVGEGSFAEVWRASFCSTTVAVKLLGSDKGGHSSLTGSLQHTNLLRKLRAEAAIMSRLRHPNICQYLGACEQPPCLVMEWCARKSLDGVLAGGARDAAAARELTWQRLLGFALGAAKGMLYLHTRSPPVLHRDLKSANLLLDSNWCVKVCDFNMSKCLEASTTASTLMLRNPRWLAPEVLDGGTGDRPADVWAFGTVLWELATWQLPYADLNAFQIISQVQRAGGACLPPLRPDALPAGPLAPFEAYAALLQACLSPRPEDRPSFKAIVQQLGALLDAQTAATAGPQHVHSVRVLRMPGLGPAASAATVALYQRRESMRSASSMQPSAASSAGASSGAPSRANSSAMLPSSPFAARSASGLPFGSSLQQAGAA